MKSKEGTTDPAFICFSCQISEACNSLDESIEWSSAGYRFKVDSPQIVKAVRKTVERCIEEVEEQLHIDENFKSLNVILKVAASIPVNTMFMLSPRDLAFFRKYKASVLIEVWETQDFSLDTDDSDAQLYKDPREVYASFRIAGRVLEPPDITDLLKLEPNSSFRASDVRKNGEVYGFGTWNISTENVKLRTNTLEQHFHYLLKVLDGQRSNLRALRERGLNTDLVVFWEANCYVTSTILSVDLLALLDSFKTNIVLDVYF